MNEGFYETVINDREVWTFDKDNVNEIMKGVYLFKKPYYGNISKLYCPYEHVVIIILDKHKDPTSEQYVYGFGCFEDFCDESANNVCKYCIGNHYDGYRYEDPSVPAMGGLWLWLR